MERVHLHFDTQRVDEVPTFFKSVILMIIDKYSKVQSFCICVIINDKLIFYFEKFNSVLYTLKGNNLGVWAPDRKTLNYFCQFN